MMICDNCGRAGIRWMGLLTNLTHTECPHCGGTNCQRPDELPEGIYDDDTGALFYTCNSCEQKTALDCEPEEFDPETAYCGRSPRCLP